jgi:hypothetical protein
MTIDGFTLQGQSEVFKTNYDKKSANMYNSANVLHGRIKKRYDFTGSERKVLTPLSFSGGVGSGRLPKSNAGKYKQAKIESKKVYATCEVEREAIHASANDEGAFVRATAETVKKAVESYMRNSSRILFGDGSGVLGAGIGAGPANVTGLGTIASPYLVQFAAAEWKESNWEEEDYVQVVTAFSRGTYPYSGTAEGGDAETNLLLVSAVNVTTRTVSLVGASPRLAALVAGTAPLAATDAIVMQRSFNTDPMGLKGVIDPVGAVTSLYDIPLQRRWGATLEDALGKGVTVDLMNKIMLQIERKFGQVPNLIMTSYEQLQNILALLEDQKVYEVGNRNLVSGKELMGKLSFKGIEFMSTRGPIGLFVDRFCESDSIYFLNDNYIECHHRPGFGWFTEDKTVFLRLQDDDAYGARYGGYYENFIVPTAHGKLKGLAI